MNNRYLLKNIEESRRHCLNKTLDSSIPEIPGAEIKIQFSLTKNSFYSNYPAFLVVILIWTNNKTLAINCHDHWDCPRDQVCEQNSSSIDDISSLSIDQKGICRCPSGYISWRWNCYPLVPTLDNHCLVSRQCQIPNGDQHRHCSPLNKKCVCDFKYRSIREECVLKDNPIIIMPNIPSSSTMNSSFEESLEKRLLNKLQDQINKTYHHDNQTQENNHNFLNLDEHYTNSLIYIGLVLLFVTVVGTISTIFMRKVRKEMKEEAMYRGFQDIISGRNEPGDTNSVASNIYGELSVSDNISYSQNPVNGNQIKEVNLNKVKTNQDKIVLAPIGRRNSESYPSPHTSAPVLPPIKNPKRKRNSLDKDLAYSIPRPDGNAQASTIEDVSKNLAEINKNTLDLRPLESAATFPGSQK